ncbi:2-hydroxymuconate tautomerase [Evansella clarkii]|jgi:4-oxalocrotonate tautomerase|uniref:2-hydroxymuconate tautomerase n=1 Tax=Evansella clarkii TaxID=79879 RepID=UPI000996B58C|nr:2-hydroxymuconate tautomerase [Evansella clarkii]
MPIVTVKLLEGRSDDQKRQLVEKVTDAVVETTNASPEKVSVIIEEMSPSHFGTGGKRVSDS